MRDLRQLTSSTLIVDSLDTDPVFHRKTFSLTRLTRGK
jgi:hypothetical protein